MELEHQVCEHDYQKTPAVPLTCGHVNEKVFLLGLVPSTADATAI